MDFMTNLSKKITVGIVGGSDLPKQKEQLSNDIVNIFPYNFSQNGLVAYKDGKIQEVQTISKFLGDDNIKKVVNWVLKYLVSSVFLYTSDIFKCTLRVDLYICITDNVLIILQTLLTINEVWGWYSH